MEEKRIVGRKAQKADDRHDEEDGEGEAPLKDRPSIRNEWGANRISHPAYEGVGEADAFAEKRKALSEVEQSKK